MDRNQRFAKNGKNYFDMENLVTRSVYRVMNKTNKIPPHLTHNQNVDKSKFSTVAIALPNNHQISQQSTTDMEMQLKLLAQEVCSKVERRYERKLEESRERDRREADRRLTSIRSEFESKYKVQLGKLEKERARLMDQLAERERTLENRTEMRIAEQEDDIEIKKRMLENRMSELMINKENFEKMKEDWRRKVEQEMEELKIERERLAVAAVEGTRKEKSVSSVEHELRMWKKRAQDLEIDANETRKRVAELTTENFKLNDQLGSNNQLKQELNVTTTALSETREELANVRKETWRTGDYDNLRNENEQLRAEIERLRLLTNKKVREAVHEIVEEYSEKEGKMKKVLGISRSRIEFLTEKCRELEMERDILKQELKTMQKMVGRSSFLPKERQKKNVGRSTSPTESTSSSLSEGEMEILNIRQRIHNLDEIAKELDASVDHFSFRNNSVNYREHEDSNEECYDDFCRALHEKSVVPKTSSPQKKVEEVEGRRPSLGFRKLEFEGEKESKRRAEEEIGQVSRNEIPEPRKEEVQLSEFEKRMKQREKEQMEQNERRKQMIQMAQEREIKRDVVIEEKVENTSPKPSSIDNPMFQGVDPVMTEYMKRIMGKREGDQPTTSKVEEVEKKKEMEITLADELDLEKEESARRVDDDEFW